MRGKTEVSPPNGRFFRSAGRGLFACFILLLAVTFLLTVYWISQTAAGGLRSTAASVPSARAVVIDPGHGGPDGGAVGYDGTLEKQINLSLSLKLADFFRASGYQVILTRSDDRSIHDSGSDTIRKMKSSDLHNRLKIENSHPEALFISIHQNKFSQSQYSGTQVFYSTNNPYSKTLAECLQNSVRSQLQPDNDRQIKPAEKNLFILYYGKPPSVMVECGFLSNPAECDKLKTDSYQKQMAFSIYSGVLRFFSGEQGSGSDKG